MVVGGLGSDYYPLFSNEIIDNAQCISSISLPTGLTHNVAISTSFNLHLVCGGFNNNKCWTFNTNNLTFDLHSTLQSSYRTRSSVVEANGKVYILGGGYGSVTGTSEVLTLGEDRWEAGPNIPGNGVAYSCAVVLNSTNILIIGGVGDSTQVTLYDTVTDTWTSWPRLSKGLERHRCIVTKDGVLVTGGYMDGQYTSQSLLLDIVTGNFETIGPMTTARGFHMLAQLGQKVFAIGGRSDSSYHTSVDEYVPISKTWVRSNYSLNVARSSFAILNVPIPASVMCG